MQYIDKMELYKIINKKCTATFKNMNEFHRYNVK